MASPLIAVYFKNHDVITGASELKTLDVVDAVTHVIGYPDTDGAQKIGGLWGVYLNSAEARIKLMNKGLVINGGLVQLYSENPYLSKQNKDDKWEKIWIRDYPYDRPNDPLMAVLKKYVHVEFTTEIRDNRVRRHGQSTKFRDGDRYIWAKGPINPPLPRQENVGDDKVRIYHPSQKLLCKVCKEFGHETLSFACPAYDPEIENVCFQGYENYMSNMYRCDIKCGDFTFKSVEEGFQFQKAVDLGDEDLALEIKTSKHAGAAKALAKKLPEEKVKAWETSKGVEVMAELLKCKFKQVPIFKNGLIDSKNKVILECTPDKFWAAGLWTEDAQNCRPNYLPGKNTVGYLMMDIRDSYLEHLVRNGVLLSDHSQLTGSPNKIWDTNTSEAGIENDDSDNEAFELPNKSLEPSTSEVDRVNDLGDWDEEPFNAEGWGEESTPNEPNQEAKLNKGNNDAPDKHKESRLEEVDGNIVMNSSASNAVLNSKYLSASIKSNASKKRVVRRVKKVRKPKQRKITSFLNFPAMLWKNTPTDTESEFTDADTSMDTQEEDPPDLE